MEEKGKFNSNFGFLASTVGSAVGIGILWGFPYKMGFGGGFTFFFLYLLTVVFVGFPLMQAEIALGRMTRKGAVEAYRKVHPAFAIAGWFACIAPFLLLCFYTSFGGYVTKYMMENLYDLLGISNAIRITDTETYFTEFLAGGWSPVIYGWIFLLATLLIVLKGVADGIEKFSTYAMPALFILLLVIVVRACSLDGADKGLAYIFKPNFDAFEEQGFLKIFGLAGSQMFFSMSLSSGALIAYGSYMGDNDNIEQSSVIIPIADTICAILAAMAVMPAVFAYDFAPDGGPNLLFVTLQKVFNNMPAGSLFAFLFYLLALFAALTSSISMMEGAVAVMMDKQSNKSVKSSRRTSSIFMAVIALFGSALVTIDQLGAAGGWHPFGQDSWLNIFDLGAEGILMPLSGLLMAILFGWIKPNYLDDEIRKGSKGKTLGFYNFSLRYLAPIFLFFILLIQLNSFFNIF